MRRKSEGDDAFAMYRVFFWIIGVWSLEDTNYFQIFRYVVAAAAQASFLLHTLTEIYLNNGKVSAMVDVFLFFASALLALTKQTFMFTNRKIIAENLKYYAKDWYEIKNEAYLKIMRTHLKIYKYQHIVYNSCGYIGTTLFLTRAVLKNVLNAHSQDFEYQLISHTSYVSQEFLAKYHVLLILIQYVQCMYVCTSGACTDCFFFGLVHHLCAQFEILKIKWQKLDTGECKDREVRIVMLIRKHQQLIRLGRNLEASFNGVVLTQLLISIILICMSGCSVLVAIMTKDYVTMLVSTNCICFMMSESFIYGYASDYLQSQSESIAQAAYSSSWHIMESRVKQNFIFVLMRAQSPLKITAGKFFNITRNTIIQLIKTTFSFLSVLRLTINVSPHIEI